MDNPIKNIYFPTDFSPASKNALPFAAGIALKTGAVLTLVHATEEPIDLAPSTKERKEALTEQARAGFQKLADRLQENKDYANVEVTTSLISGHPVVNLLDMVHERKPDLIVMGTRGAGSARNALIGSMATGVIAQSPVPVLVVPPESRFEGFGKIHIATDYKEGDLKALRWLQEFGKPFGSKLEAVHIAAEKSFLTEMNHRGFRSLAAETVGKPKLPVHLAYHDDFHEGISLFMEEHHTSLLVMVRYRKTFFDSLLSTAHTKEMGLFGRRPLLVLVGEEQ